MAASAAYVRNAHYSAVVISHPVFTVMIYAGSPNCESPHLFFWEEDKAGIVTRGTVLSQAADSEGSDLANHTLEGMPLRGLLGFCVCVRFFFFPIHHDLLAQH